MRRKKLLTGIQAMLICLTMAACSDAKKETDISIEAPAEEIQTITVAWAESDSTQVEVMNDYVKPALEEAFPDIQFAYTGIATDKAEALKTMSATGGLTDIYCSDSGIYGTMLAAGDMLDLAPYLEKDGWLAENYSNPSLLYNGDTIYNISCGQNDYYTPVIYYNTELFQKYGIEEPETMEEFLEICQILLDHGVYPLTTSTTFVMNFFPDALISSYDPQALNDLHARKCDWTDERIVQAMQVFDKLKLMGAFSPDSATKRDADCLGEFSDGTAAMWPTMSWYNYDVTEENVGFVTGTFNWPSGNAQYETNYQQLNWGSVYGGWAVNPNADDVDTCVKVLKVILKAEAQRHADSGIAENFIVEDAAEPTNPIEIERMEDYKEAEEYRTLLCITGMDTDTLSEYTTCLRRLVSDDRNYLSEDFILEFNSAWKRNTKAPD